MSRAHPLHPLLAHFPLALLVLTSVLDALALAGHERLWRAAFVDLVAGLAAAAPAALTGLLELRRIAQDSPEESLAMRHMGIVLLALCVEGASALVRATGGLPPPLVAPALSAAGAVLLAVAGWYGAELVYGHGVGVRGVAPPRQPPEARCEPPVDDGPDASRARRAPAVRR